MTTTRPSRPALGTRGSARLFTRPQQGVEAVRGPDPELRDGELLDLVTLGFADEAAADIGAAGASWALGEDAAVERAGTTVRVRAAGAADRVARFITDLAAAGAPVGRVEVLPHHPIGWGPRLPP